MVDVFQFTLKNDISRFLAYNYYCLDTGRSFEPIFMKFAWLVRVHTRVNPIYFFFWNNRSNRTIDMGENVPPKLVFWLSFGIWGFWGKKFKAVFGTPISYRKGYIYICRPTPHSLKNGRALQKLFFVIILENIYIFFLFKLLYEKYSKPHFLQKSYTDFCRQTPLPSKWSCPPINGLSQFFQYKL